VEEVQHIISYDSKGYLLDGGKKYKLHLPPDIPASDFWSVIVYDALSRLMIRSSQPWPSVFSSDGDLVRNKDKSVDVWFGPETGKGKGKESNWIKTKPGEQWYMILRLYYPLESWFNKKWRPGELEEFK